jgi:hypothetical protein
MARHPPSPAATTVLVHVSSSEVATRTPGAISRKRSTPPYYRTAAGAATYQERARGLCVGKGAVNIT